MYPFTTVNGAIAASQVTATINMARFNRMQLVIVADDGISPSNGTVSAQLFQSPNSDGSSGTYIGGANTSGITFGANAAATVELNSSQMNSGNTYIYASINTSANRKVMALLEGFDPRQHPQADDASNFGTSAANRVALTPF